MIELNARVGRSIVAAPRRRSRRVGRSATAVGLAVLLHLVVPPAMSAATLTLASTTSTENSGLLAYLLPRFQAATGISVRVVAVGTGAALRIAEAGDADVLLVHDRQAEEAFVAAGHGVARHDVMFNDFVLVGPSDDPAGVRRAARAAGAPSILLALRHIAANQAPFVSRGDDSGTHRAEMRLWARAGLDPGSMPTGWYRSAGAGMGATLNTANAMQAYTLSDRGTWLSFRNRDDLDIIVEGDPPLRNPYGVIRVNPERHPHVASEAGKRFVEWMTGPAGQEAIGAFRIDGEVLFHPVRPPAAAEATPAGGVDPGQVADPAGVR